MSLLSVDLTQHTNPFFIPLKNGFVTAFRPYYRLPRGISTFSENSKWHLLTENGYCELSLRNVRRRTLHAEKMEMFVQCHF